MDEWIKDPRVIVSVIAAILGIGYWVGQVNSDRKSLKEFMDEIRKDIKDILGRLPPPRPVQGSSPLSLTEFGERIADDIKARDWALSLARSLFDDVGAMEPFEIDEYCDAYVRNKLDDAWQRQVARCAFDFGIDRDGVLSVLRVVLRDALLALRNG